MAGGGKGGSQSTEVEIPKWLEGAAKGGIDRGERIAEIGYVPYSGPNVAALTGGQNSAISNTNAAAEAFGMQGNTPMPTPETFAGGVQGYSSIGLYNEAIERLKNERPGQYEAIMSLFVDPQNGGTVTAPEVAAEEPVYIPPHLVASPTQLSNFSSGPGGAQNLPNMHDEGNRSYGGGGGVTTGGGLGGYTGMRDMVDGGGPGRSGGAFMGGGRLSDLANTMTNNNSGGGFGGGK